MSYQPHDQSSWLAEHVQPHEPMLRAWLCSRFSGIRDIDDIVQEAYLRLCRAHQKGEVKVPKAYFFAIARNIAVDFARRQNLVPMEALVESDYLFVSDESETIPESVARHQELAILTEAIQSLPERCRQIFTLRKIYGLSQQEIAVRLAISEHTVSAQLTIGLHKCTEFFARNYYERGRGHA